MGDGCTCEQASLARFEGRRRGIGVAGIAFGVAAGILIPAGIRKASDAACYQGGIGCALASLIMMTSWVALGDHRRIVNIEGCERDQTVLMGAAFDELSTRRKR